MLKLSESSITAWLAETRTVFVGRAPGLLPLFDTYAAEAAFGRRYLDRDLARLHPGSSILEVGAGSLLLSCQLVREGFDVTALEPTGSGFSHFEQLRQLVRERAESLGYMPRLVDLPAEAFAEENRYNFAFSVNVMEHVNDVPRVMGNIVSSLVAGASYRFTCPNYLFPYEPHFNIPTFFSKKLTGKLLYSRIFESKRMPDPAGVWQSLNWINVLQVKHVARRLTGVSITFDRALLVSTLERVAVDENFARRRSPAIRKILSVLVRLRLHQMFRLLPAMFQPIMDCRLKKMKIQG